MADDPLITIGHFARATGLTIKALRLYAESGVLEPDQVNESSGYRLYRASQVATGQLVRHLRQLGIPVAEVSEVLVALAGGADPAALLTERLRADEHQLAERRRLLRHLTQLLKGDTMSHHVTIREVSPGPALYRRGRVTQDQLAEFGRDAYAALYAAAGQGPLTLTGPAYMRYHGRMDDLNTTLEVDACLPFAGDRAQPRGLPESVDVLPASTYQLASTVLRGPETIYPQTLDGYDAVADWISRHGFHFAGPAMELYQSWHGETGHPDNVMEVGFPVTTY